MRTRFWRALALLTFVAGTASSPAASRADEKSDGKPTISDVMNKGMKKGLWKRVARGEASKAESEELLALFTALAEHKPPKGDEKSWQDKTGALVAAAKAAVAGQPDAGEKLAAATSCVACHRAHK